MASLRALAFVCLMALASGAAIAADPAEAEILPGRPDPAALAAPMAYRFAWDEYVSVAVIGDTAANGLRRQAWVVTYDRSGSVVVGYRATAFRDKLGILHIDARKSAVSGPQHESWSPDSFAITGEGDVHTMDDVPQHPRHRGALTETLAADGEAYRTLLRIAMAIANGIS